MSMALTKQRPIPLTSSQKRDVRTQFGALCYRIKRDKVQILLVTSRRNGRWIIPKGWPVAGATPAQAAAREAWEEAGVEGRVLPVCIGLYSYVKDFDDDRLPCVVAVFPLRVSRLGDDFPEASQRKRKWVSAKKAARLLDQPELGQIIRQFNPRVLRR